MSTKDGRRRISRDQVTFGMLQVPVRKSRQLAAKLRSIVLADGVLGGEITTADGPLGVARVQLRLSLVHEALVLRHALLVCSLEDPHQCSVRFALILFAAGGTEVATAIAQLLVSCWLAAAGHSQASARATSDGAHLEASGARRRCLHHDR